MVANASMDNFAHNLVKQIIEGSLSRLSFNRAGGLNSNYLPDIRAITNGLWHCHSDGDAATEVTVGLYARGGGEQLTNYFLWVVYE